MRTITTYAELTAGEQILTIYCDKAGYNIDCMDFISLHMLRRQQFYLHPEPMHCL